MLRYLIAATYMMSACCAAGIADDSNRLAYLRESNPWYPDKDFPKLTTPQWVGEDGVECVVVLAIDDMRDTAKYEQYLRPILNRLKQIDGRASVSIMANSVKPDDPLLQVWIDEGLSIECHTADHPCPLLKDGDFEKARSTYNRCIDQLAKIPRSKPVAFRTPCCDSLNTVSPRFYSEIFPQATAEGNFLQIDSSVMNFFTSEDESIPRELVLDEDGNERFWKYKVKNLKRGETVHNNFVNYITNYPYPYVISNSCWQFPCVAPSDWSAQHLHGINNQQTVDDWKAALDITVHKQGVFNLVFHPHGWIKAEQVVELIDHAVSKHGRKVQFLTFREAADRLNRHLLDGHPIRSANGTDNGIRILDVDRDGFQDVVIGNDATKETRVWQPDVQSWTRFGFPASISSQSHFARVRDDGRISVLLKVDHADQVWRFEESGWKKDHFLQDLVSFSTAARKAPVENFDRGVANDTPSAHRHWRFHDIDHDGVDEVVVTWYPVADDGKSASLQKPDIQLFRTTRAAPSEANGPREPVEVAEATWRRLRFPWPTGSAVPASGLDPTNFCFADLNQDGFDDLVGSGSKGAYVALFDDFDYGWTQTVLDVDASSERALPPIRRADGGQNGFAVRGRTLYWLNESTSDRTDLFERVSFDELLDLQKDEEARNGLPTVPIGAAVIDITPDYPVRLTGYGNRSAESEGVASRIHARALVIGGAIESTSVPSGSSTSASNDCCGSDDSPSSEPVLSATSDILSSPATILITVDNCGVPANVTEAVFARVAAKHGIPRSRFAISSTHTHSGPWLRDFAPNIFASIPDEHAARLKKYEDWLIDQLVEVVDQAMSSRRPGHLSLGFGKLDFAVNRRSLNNGQWTGFGEVNEGPTDKRFLLLAAQDTEGKLIAVLGNYACHATTETGQLNSISGDWPGIAASNIEDLYPGAVALIAIGCGADANPSPRGTHDLAKRHAETVSKEVRRLLGGLQLASSAETYIPQAVGESQMVRIDPDIICDIERIDLPLGPVPSSDELQSLAGDSGVIGSRARYFLNLLEEGKQIPTTVPNYPVQTWCFGEDLAMVFLAGEVVVDYSIRMHEMFDGDRLWINAYSNDVPCYIASKRILREGGYEADSSMRYYRQPTRLAPETEDIICDTVQKLLHHHFYSDQLKSEFPAPKSPEESLGAITVRPGLKAELVASEPLISDPVAFDWDVHGRLWVVEMGGYPAGKPRRAGKGNEGFLRGASEAPSLSDTGEGVGRVRVLEDLDGDGRYDKSVTFLEGLSFPTGLHPWRDGWLITCAPDIIYAEDTNGDFVADKQTVLYTGFTEGNQQHRINGMRWGLDGWLYLANGDSGGEVRAVGSVLDETSEISGKPINIRGRDIRIHPDSGAIETLSGQSQSGRNRDDFGNWFGNNNSNPIWHYVLEDRYLKRNPFAIGLTTKSQVAEIPGAAPVYPTSKTLARFNDFHAANRFTSACSTAIYRDNLLGKEFYGNAFTCEPVHNLVSRLVLEPDGATFQGRRAADEQTSEFFASSDSWTRPVMVRTGPDGAIYIADMYRQVIEHPEWIPAEYQRKMDLYAGNTLGRIYRIVPDPAATSFKTDETDETRDWLEASDSKITIDELLGRLASPNGWWRDTAQRILAHRNSVLPEQKLLSLLGHQSAAVRVQAIAAMAQASTTSQQEQNLSRELARRLGDPDPEVRRNILRFEDLLVGEEMELSRIVPDLMTSTSQVDLHQLALSMGVPGMDEGDAAFILQELLKRHGNEASIRAAAYTSITTNKIEYILQSFSKSPETVPVRVFGDILRMAAAFEKGPAVVRAFESLLATLADERKNGSSDTWESAVGVSQQIRQSLNLRELVSQTSSVQAAWEDASRIAVDRSVANEEQLSVRLAALRFLAAGNQLSEGVQNRLLGLFVPESPPEIQQEVIRTLAATNSKLLTTKVYDQWNRLTPSVRFTALETTLAQPQRTLDLLAAVESGKLTAADVGATYRERLLNYPNSEVRVTARTILGSTTLSARASIVETMKSEIEDLESDPTSGREVFRKQCSICHQIGDVGKQIGADLVALKDRSTDALLVAILDPNRAVEARFFSYTASTTDGRTFSGMLQNETGNSLTLLGTDGKERVIARTLLEELTCNSRSLMPEGLEKDLSSQDLADVIAFVQSSGTTGKRFRGNQPRLITASEDGTLTLPATAAEIHGPNLVFEDKFQNLGWWSSTDDYAVWTIDVPRSGHWTVEFDYACDNSTAGNAIKLSTGTRLLTARVPGTGTWNDYRKWSVGKIDLGKGGRRLTVTAPEQPTSALIDLKSIRLIPPR